MSRTSQLPGEIGLLITSNDLNNEPLREGGYRSVTLMYSLGENRFPKWRFKWGKHGTVSGEGEEKA